MLLGPERRWCAAVAACQITMVLSGCAGGKSTADAPASDAGVALADAGGDGALIEDAQACAQPLFGQPGAHTGLNAEQCAPRCGCAGAVWTPRSWDAAALDALRATELVDGAPVPAVDPYAVATLDVAPPPAAAVCGVRWDAAPPAPGAPRRYQLRDYADAAAAAADAAVVTHAGRCGLCSSLIDLAVYAAKPDLTGPVRQCGLQQLSDGFDASVACLRALGFSSSCATVWAWNTRHTREKCLQPCMALLSAPSHAPDGSLNACIACDEVESGPVFKAVAGRTRRNSGLPSALCRPCGSVAAIDHVY